MREKQRHIPLQTHPGLPLVSNILSCSTLARLTEYILCYSNLLRSGYRYLFFLFIIIVTLDLLQQ